METLEVKNTMPKLGFMTGSQAVVQALIAEGVDLMFGYGYIYIMWKIMTMTIVIVMIMDMYPTPRMDSLNI